MTALGDTREGMRKALARPGRRVSCPGNTLVAGDYVFRAGARREPARWLHLVTLLAERGAYRLWRCAEQSGHRVCTLLDDEEVAAYRYDRPADDETAPSGA